MNSFQLIGLTFTILYSYFMSIKLSKLSYQYSIWREIYPFPSGWREPSTHECKKGQYVFSFMISPWLGERNTCTTIFM